MRTPLCPLLAVSLSAATRSSFDLHQLLRFHLSFLGYNISQTSSLPWRITKFRFLWDWNIEAMRREISFLVQPRCLLLLLVLSILLIFALFASKRAEEKEEHPEITHRVFLDVDIDGQRLGRIVIGLYGQVVPKLWKILELCAQGGDIVHHDGRGYESVYGGTFPDENFKTKHSHAGVVSMVNSGPDSNGSLFFITTVKASWLDGEHVVFGKVVQGMDTVFAIEGGAGTYSGKPRKKVVIADSGEIPKSQWDDER